MDLQKMFYLQKKLDERIMTEHDINNADVIQERVLALSVELGELANETRCFKYWSTKAPSNRHVILEEYVDGIHFILSLGISLQYEQIDRKNLVKAERKHSAVEAFLQVFAQIARFNEEKSFREYEKLFSQYLSLGETLGFSAADIEEAYLMKNEVNHRRQDTGY